jgi:hypothetical protein
MSMRSIAVIAALWVLSLFVVGTIVQAQSYAVNPLPPKTVFGDDFGFRIIGEQNGALIGTPLVKVNGKWVEVKIGSIPSLAH